MIYQFKVTLKDVGIPVWRRLQIDSESTFEELHYILMISFEWQGYHLHDFEIRKSNGKRTGNIRIEPQEDHFFNEVQSPLADLGVTKNQLIDFGFPQMLNEKKEKLSDWFKIEKDRVFYTYDFGDNWEHEITLEKILEPDQDVLYPICIKAKNDSPPEDSRHEIISNEIDLENSNWKMIVEYINEEFDTEDWKENFIDRNDFF